MKTKSIFSTTLYIIFVFKQKVKRKEQQMTQMLHIHISIQNLHIYLLSHKKDLQKLEHVTLFVNSTELFKNCFFTLIVNSHTTNVSTKNETLMTCDVQCYNNGQNIYAETSKFLQQLINLKYCIYQYPYTREIQLFSLTRFFLFHLS